MNKYLYLQINHANIMSYSPSRQKHSSSLVILASRKSLLIHCYGLSTRVVVNLEGWIVQKVQSILEMFQYSLVKQPHMIRVVRFMRQYVDIFSQSDEPSFMLTYINI